MPYFQSLLPLFFSDKCPPQPNAHVIVLRAAKSTTFTAIERLISLRVINAVGGKGTAKGAPRYANFTRRICALTLRI